MWVRRGLQKWDKVPLFPVVFYKVLRIFAIFCYFLHILANFCMFLHVFLVLIFQTQSCVSAIIEAKVQGTTGHYRLLQVT